MLKAPSVSQAENAQASLRQALEEFTKKAAETRAKYESVTSQLPKIKAETVDETAKTVVAASANPAAYWGVTNDEGE